MRRFVFFSAIAICFFFSLGFRSREPAGAISEEVVQNASQQNIDEGPAHPAFSEISKFHGHVCPGSAMGYRMACAAMDRIKLLGIDPKDLMAIVETNTCGVDGLQCVSGCTFGKGKLLFDDYGKNVYTLFSAKTRKGVRVVFHGDGVPKDLQENRAAYIEWLLTASAEKIVSVKEASVERTLPERTNKSAKCSICGELANIDKMKEADSKRFCIPCSIINK